MTAPIHEPGVRVAPMPGAGGEEPDHFLVCPDGLADCPCVADYLAAPAVFIPDPDAEAPW